MSIMISKIKHLLVAVLCCMVTGVVLSGCKDDNDMFVDMPSGGTLTFVEEIEGTVRQENGKWMIRHYVPNTIDTFNHYYPVEMPHTFCKNNLKVRFAGYACRNDLQSNYKGVASYAGVYCYTIILTKIVKE